MVKTKREIELERELKKAKEAQKKLQDEAIRKAAEAEDAIERARLAPGLEIQPRNNFFQAAVPPLSNSEMKLPGGRSKPFYYCLGVDSTVPFVSLQGGGASQKIFSWGEMIEVLPGQTVIVKNESYMLGDIQINSGHDYAAKPERISLPVDIIQFQELGPFPITLFFTEPKFPADTRRCRRAYLKYQIETQAAQVDITFTGKPIKHSFPAVDSITGIQTYTQNYTIPPFTLDGEAPMGYGSNSEILTPMGFTDQVTWQIVYAGGGAIVPPFINTLFMYVLEY